MVSLFASGAGALFSKNSSISSPHLSYWFVLAAIIISFDNSLLERILFFSTSGVGGSGG